MNDFAHGPSTIRIGDLEVRRLGFGAMQLPGPEVWGEPKDPAKARAVLKRTVELGINFIDTSWYYGPFVSNRLIAETLHPYAKDLVIATKLGGKRLPDKSWVAALRPEELRQGCEEDLRTLRLERIDVTHLRIIPHSDVPFRESLDAMIGLQKEGKIRHLALSNVTLDQLREAMAITPIVGVQNLYNVIAGEKKLANFPMGVVAGQEQMLDFCAEKGLAFLPYFPLALPGPRKMVSPVLGEIAKKHGATEAQIAIAWLLARSKALLPIPGTSSPAHLDENWAARTIALDKAEIEAITAARS
ncbi:putative oxidoreductase [Labilithrix luteola]|uniref:Putative oxidoreductase n=1 Tax=Labilithrix luteola TaxID=1391654 RepID=A0A0K1Q2M5_9BACT|nr:aldo/keto reductase [Labilithrix luteola]AKU99639.1 putative oxidoreductase [Labilithrix luteola]